MTADTKAMAAARIPGDIVLEPNERVILGTKPLALWFPVAVLLIVLWAAALWLGALGEMASFVVLTVVAAAATAFFGIRWLQWRARWFVLTDRRVITRWGVLHRNQAGILLERIQSVVLERPFLLSYLRGYGILKLETAGEQSSERLTGGLNHLAMEHAAEFHLKLNDAITPDD